MTALLTIGGDAALGWQTAADSLGIARLVDHRLIHVVTGRTRPTPLDGVRVHASRSLVVEDVVVIDGRRTTTVARTLVDLASELGAHELVSYISEAAFRERLDRVALLAALDRNRTRRSTASLLRALDLYDHGSAGFRSRAEQRAFSRCRRELGSEPLVNATRRVGTRTYELDLLWRAERVCIEVDGGQHLLPDVARRDAERDARLRQAGYLVFRIPAAWVDFVDLGAIRAALEERHRSPSRDQSM